ncbi:hypothetical protein KY362_03075 [Candidatus Woesearchaeota archaeon]|nr:hypothetical protein [Candidatus Woesearchaeota archaeon]
MGAPSDYLVPAAVLYDNPGLTLEEFGKRLTAVATKVHGVGLAMRMPFDALGMARILNLEHTPEFEALPARYDGEHGVTRRYYFGDFDGSYRVHHTAKRRVTDSEIIISSGEFNSTKPFEVGDLVHDDEFSVLPFPWKECPADYALCVTEVLETKSELEDFDRYDYVQKLKGFPVAIRQWEDRFTDVDSMAEAYPEYAPDNVFDFSPESGTLFPTKRDYQFHTDHPLRWIRRGDRYRLDPASLVTELSPNSYYTTIAKQRRDVAETGNWTHPGVIKGFSLTDLVLTCEAVRRERWDVLGYNGLFDRVFDFMYSDEQTLERFERAQRDSEVSMMARNAGMTHSEMLRERLFTEAVINQQHRWNGTEPLSFEKRVAIYETEKAEREKAAEERKAAREKEKKENPGAFSEDDMPF